MDSFSAEEVGDQVLYLDENGCSVPPRRRRVNYCERLWGGCGTRYLVKEVANKGMFGGYWRVGIPEDIAVVVMAIVVIVVVIIVVVIVVFIVVVIVVIAFIVGVIGMSLSILAREASKLRTATTS